MPARETGAIERLGAGQSPAISLAMKRLPPNIRAPYVIGECFWGVRDVEAFYTTQERLLETLPDPTGGIFVNDNTIAIQRSLAFTRDAAFMTAYRAHAKTESERGVIWRTATLVWAARQALRLDGAFVECGCYKGTSARILVDAVGLTRPFHIYDLFDHNDSMGHHSMPEHGPDLFSQVKARFADAPNVVVTQGRVPDSLTNAPKQIAFLHVDMNNVDAEIGALEMLFDRMVPGGVVILDDFGWLAYRRQQVAEIDWFARRGYPVLELATGQGMVIR